MADEKIITLDNLKTFKNKADETYEKKLTTTSVTDGTISKNVGFDSSGNLVKGDASSVEVTGKYTLVDTNGAGPFVYLDGSDTSSGGTPSVGMTTTYQFKYNSTDSQNRTYTVATTDDIPTVTSTYSATSTDAMNGVAVASAISTKQDKLTFDTTPTADSTNPVTSGGIKTALDAKQDAISTTSVLTFTLADGTTKTVTVYTKE